MTPFCFLSSVIPSSAVHEPLHQSSFGLFTTTCALLCSALCELRWEVLRCRSFVWRDSAPNRFKVFCHVPLWKLYCLHGELYLFSLKCQERDVGARPKSSIFVSLYQKIKKNFSLILSELCKDHLANSRQAVICFLLQSDFCLATLP